MIKSMTGFGRETYSHQNKNINIEIRTLNSKYFDLNLKIPNYIREQETEIRNILSNELERGKIEISVSIEIGKVESSFINKPVFESYFRELEQLSEKMDCKSQTDIFSLVMRYPDIYIKEHDNFDSEDWEMFAKQLLIVCKKVNEFRFSEGELLKEKMKGNINKIKQLLDSVAGYEETRLASIRERILKHVDYFFTDAQADKNRFEQEIIYYIEKLDITEEKVRLLKHLNFFLDSIEEQKSNGKKLGFVAQEIGREINTLGSKANNFEIQQIVVNMKDELEQIKEQLGNIL